jgi:hypothetical protein
LHLVFKLVAISAIPLNETRTFGHSRRLPAIETDNLMAMLEQQPNNWLADISRSTNNADFHNIPLFRAERSAAKTKRIFSSNYAFAISAASSAHIVPMSFGRARIRFHSAMRQDATL